MGNTVLLVDDDPVQRRLLEATLIKLGHTTLKAEDGAQALDVLSGSDQQRIDLVLLDLVMPVCDGMGVLEGMREQGIEIPVIVQTAQGGIETVVNAMRAGACDFVVKPASYERLKVSIDNALKIGAMERAAQTIRKSVKGTFTFDDILPIARQWRKSSGWEKGRHLPIFRF